MPTEVTFDNATLADAVQKAGRVAPSKGAGFDKAAGIHFSVNADTREVIVRATNLEITYEQRIYATEVKGNSIAWRIPSVLLTGIAAQLPMGEGHTMKFIDRADKWIRMKAGRLVTKLALLSADDYPMNAFDTFDMSDMTPAQELANKVEQVAWSVDKKSKSGPLGGVHIDGTRIIGCCPFHLAIVPCDVGIDAPVTVPLASMTAILKNASSVRCRASGKRFQLALDDETRASCGLLEGKYPNIDAVMRSNFTGSAKIHKGAFVDTLSNMFVLIRQEKLPTLTLELNGTGLIKTVTFDMEVPETGRMQNSIDIETDYDSIFRLNFMPHMIHDAVANSKSDYVTLDFGHPEGRMDMVRFTDDRGYICYVMPKKENA